jgi:superfamily II DNA or RNA helicase
MPTLKDILSRLTYTEACALLGPHGARLLRQGGQREIRIDEQVRMDEDEFLLSLGEATVTVHRSDGTLKRLVVACSACATNCEHQAAALSLILEEKLALGLAAPPTEDLPLEMLTMEQLVERALADRAERAAEEKMVLKATRDGGPWTDYAVISRFSGKTYRVALRGREPGESYCSCPDFQNNTLGTCKHIIFSLETIRRKYTKADIEKPYVRKGISLHLRYGEQMELRLALPEKPDEETEPIVARFRGRPIRNIPAVLKAIRQLERMGRSVTIYPDAEEYVNMQLLKERLRLATEGIRKDPRLHPLRKSLLRMELLPYQLDGIAFAVSAGRAVLADDMGLGKTIQGIGTAELLAREAGISRVLVICPTSLKSQWIIEIRRASDRTCRIVAGSAEERAGQYSGPEFFSVCNYEQVIRDLPSIEAARWDLIILDEGQRIKNWEAKTARVVKALRSPFALVLTGTPLENKLDELYSVVQFIDNRRLGPAFRFFHDYRVVNERGRVLGYKNLEDLRKNLSPVLLRRTRRMVLSDLPPRTTEIRRIAPTKEQADIHDGHKRIIASIIAKRYISEMDLLRLQKALLACRMAADGTFLVDRQEPGFSSKLVELEGLLGQLLAEPERKIIVFSEWTTMLNLIQPILDGLGAAFVRLDGSVPQKKRQGLVNRFQADPDCRLFLTTNAGSTGLNLQAADTVINVDLPWNPAVLEQRIARAHRMGQRRPVQVYLLVTEKTIEESMLATLGAKQELSLAVLDPDSALNEVSLSAGVEELRRRLEVLTGAVPEAPVNESRRRAETEEAARVRRDGVARAGGTLLSAAFSFVGEILQPKQADTSGTAANVQRFQELLAECVQKNDDGSLSMTVRFPDEAALQGLAAVLGRIAAQAGGTEKG